MKSYTNLEQSKMLAEILSIESADMFYYKDAVTKEDNPRVMNFLQVPKSKSMYYSPCWSLAALLSVLPIVYINNKKEVCGPLHIDITDSETPFVLWYVNPLHKGSIIELKTKECDNLVDACVEMIEKLHEQNLI